MMRLGSSGDDVRQLQLTLNAKGAKLATDGVFGRATEVAVQAFQKRAGLTADGVAGPKTMAALRGPARLPLPRVYPLRALKDGRKPTVTSGFHTRNPSRPTHKGADLFYRYLPTSDPAMRAGDGGRTSSNWWIPDGTPASACAPGVVSIAGPSRTGSRVWIDHGDGWHVGYFHLSRLHVKPGDLVDAGLSVGIVGDNPGAYDARHLHFELYFGDLGGYPAGCRDPESWLEGATVLAAP